MLTTLQRDVAVAVALLDRLPAGERAGWLPLLDRPTYRFAGPGLAVASSALGGPRHPDLRLLAQRRRRFLLGAVASATATRHVHRDRRPTGGDQALHRRTQRAAQALHLDQPGRRHPQQPGCTFRLSQCTSEAAYLNPPVVPKAFACKLGIVRTWKLCQHSYRRRKRIWNGTISND
jgi:hypothetical protein